MADNYDSLGRRITDRFDAFGRRIDAAAEKSAPFIQDSEHWVSFEPTQLFPDSIRGAVSTLDDLLKVTTAAGKLTSKALRLAQRAATLASTNPIETVIRNALSQIDSFVQGIEGNVQCHAIMIPIRRKTVRRGPDDSSLFDAYLSLDEPAYAYVAEMKTAKAGTKKFFSTLVASLADAGDINRPQFPSNYATTGVCLIAGAESLSDLQVPLRLFTNLFHGDGQRIPPSANTLPVVQNLKITPAGIRGGTGVVLRWTPLPPRTNLPFFTNDSIKAKEIFLIRTTEPPGITTWETLFPGVVPPDSRTNLPENATSKVIARITNHGFATSYTDMTNLLDPTKTYYFTACVRYTINDGEAQMGSLSNTVRVTRTNPSPSSRRGIPPDWIATPSLAALIPPLQRVTNLVRLEISRLGSRTSSNSGAQQMMVQTVNQLDRLVQQWEATANQLSELTGRLNSITALNTPSGVYATLITKPSGGHEAWIAELSRRLADTTDTTRPQLSDEAVVIGYVIMAGAPRLPDLSAVIALMKLLFGKHDKSPLLEVNRALDGTPSGATPTTTSTATPILGYDAALRPSPRPTC